MASRAEYDAFVVSKRCPLCRGRRKATRGVLCRVCSAKHNAAQNARYAQRRAANICDWCRGPSDGKVYCAKCRKRRAQQPARKEPRGDRYLSDLKRNALRSAARGVTLDRDAELYRVAKQQALESDAYEREIANHMAWMRRATRRADITRVHALRSLLELGLAQSKKLQRKAKR